MKNDGLLKYVGVTTSHGSRHKKLKDIELIENTNIRKKFKEDMRGQVPFNEEKKINFNIIEKSYFFIRRKLESRKKSRKNY